MGDLIPSFEEFSTFLEDPRSDFWLCCTQPSQMVRYSATGSSADAGSTATSPPATDPDGVVNRHQMVTHKSVNCSWASRARGHLFGELLSILEEPEQAEGIFRDYLP